MIHNDTWYEVKTHWGWFRLDEGAYRDYLQGKLWITWKPGRPQEQQKIDGAVERLKEGYPENVFASAFELPAFSALAPLVFQNQGLQVFLVFVLRT